MTDTASPPFDLQPGDAIGLLGGGQLGRMIAIAAANLGLKVHVLAPEKDAPAGDVAVRHICADYENEDALKDLAAGVRAATLEFESVPVAAVETLQHHVPVRPGAKALRVAQDRLEEKQFLSGLGIPVAPFADVSSEEGLQAALDTMTFPAILKTRRFGYDGKGQTKVGAAGELRAAWESLGRVPCCLEAFVDFDGEASIITARAPSGVTATYDLVENAHANHILSESRVPARWAGTHTAEAIAAAEKIAAALDYIGVLTVEFFVTGTGLIANEIAPRVHNSGHWTIEGAESSQFENHVRAICGWPLGATKRRGTARMINMIGADANNWPTYLSNPGAHLHLYGKSEIRDGRKMGHVTWVSTD